MNSCKNCGWFGKKVYTTLYGQRVEYQSCILCGESPDLYNYNSYDDVPPDWECSAWISEEERKELEELRDEIAKDWGIERHKELVAQQEWENRRLISMIEDEMTYEERDQLAEAREIVNKDFEHE